MRTGSSTPAATGRARSVVSRDHRDARSPRHLPGAVGTTAILGVLSTLVTWLLLLAGPAAAPAATAAALDVTDCPAVFGRDPVANTKSIYSVTTDGRLAQVWDADRWNVDFPAELGGFPGLRFAGCPAVFGRDPVANTKSIYSVTTDGRLAQVWDADRWNVDFPAELGGFPGLRFAGCPAVFGRDPVAEHEVDLQRDDGWAAGAGVGRGSLECRLPRGARGLPGPAVRGLSGGVRA